MNIKINNNFLFYGGYKLKCAIGKSGIVDLKKRLIWQHQRGHLNLVDFTTEKIELSK
jgi:hypothetical protein